MDELSILWLSHVFDSHVDVVVSLLFVTCLILSYLEAHLLLLPFQISIKGSFLILFVVIAIAIFQLFENILHM